jgi:hypothetical protein
MGVRLCEPRVALSASVAADFLLSAMESPDQNPAAAPDASWLLEQASQVHDQYGLDGGGQTVAVIDSGIAWDHLALGEGYGPGYRVVGGWDFAENDSDPYDDGPAGFHGSHVAGLIAGESDAFRGMAPGADLVALRVFNDSGVGSLDAIESALQWVHDHRDAFASPITTVNLSLGAILTDANSARVTAQLGDELQQLYGDGIFVAAAAGNGFDSDFPDRLTYPANSPAVTAVGSIDTDGQISGFSQRRPGILTAPGRGIVSTVPDHVLGWDGNVDDLVAANGTSMAAPQVAGAATLVREAILRADADADVSPAAITEHLQATARDQTDAATGQLYYTVDLSRAVETLLGSATGQADPGTPGSEGEEPPLPAGISLQAGRLELTGTAESDTMLFDLSDGLYVEINGAGHRWSAEAAAAIEQVTLDGAAGNDHLQVIGSTLTERLTLHANASSNTSSNTSIDELVRGDQVTRLRGIENVRFEGNGGADRVTLFDSSRDDRLEARPGSAALSGVGYAFEIDDVPRIYVHATAGGEDTAFLHDSSGDDRLAVRPQFTSLRGDAHFNLAYGFERVYAYATAGGHDVASLYDSAGDDRMTASAASAFISGPGYYASARHFERVEANATAGGNDRATLYAADAQADWHHTADLVQLDLPAATAETLPPTRVARGFGQVETFVAGEPILVSPLAFADPTGAPLWQAEADEPRGRAALLEEAARAWESEGGSLPKPGQAAAVAHTSWPWGSLEDLDRKQESEILAEVFAELDDEPT